MSSEATSTKLPYMRFEQPPAAAVPSYKYWSIFNTLCCCLPLGLVGIFYSGQVEECLARRDVAGARSASQTAKTINIIALVIGLVVLGVFIFFMLQRLQLLDSLYTSPPTQAPRPYMSTDAGLNR